MVDIPFIRGPRPAYAQAETLSPLITRITARNPGPFTFTGTGTFLIGRDSVSLIDPGPDMAEHLNAIESALDGKHLSHILLTHHHADHSALAPRLAKRHKCNIYGMRPKPTRPDTFSIRLEEGTDPSFNPDIEIRDGDEFSGPDWHLKAVHTPGHTSNHVCFALAEENTLFSGDHIMGWATSVVIPPDGDMGAYLASLARIKHIGFDTIRPTHGPAIQETAPFIQAYIGHRLAREAQILDSVKTGHSRIIDIVSHLYTDIDKRLYPAAGVSVFAHLLHLIDQKKVDTIGPPSLQSEYRFIA